LEEPRQGGSKGAEASFVVRKARAEDVPDVIRVNRAALPENYPEYFFYEHLEQWPEAFLVAEVEGRVVGYVMCRVEVGFGYFTPLPLKKGHIVSLAVLEGYRRRGIGTKLMQEAISALKNSYGAREVYLEVRVSNEPAIRLYKKLGFREVKRVPAYYLDGEDAYIMAMPL